MLFTLPQVRWPVTRARRGALFRAVYLWFTVTRCCCCNPGLLAPHDGETRVDGGPPSCAHRSVLGGVRPSRALATCSARSIAHRSGAVRPAHHAAHLGDHAVRAISVPCAAALRSDGARVSRRNRVGALGARRGGGFGGVLTFGRPCRELSVCVRLLPQPHIPDGKLHSYLTPFSQPIYSLSSPTPEYRSYYSDVFWLVSLSYFILGAGLVLQPLASRPRAAISALVVALKTLASIAITLRVSEPLQMPPSRVLLSCLGGTAFSHLLGVLAMSTADHTRKQLTLPHSRADELKPSAGPAEQPQPQRIDPLVLQQVLQQVQQPNSSPSWLLGLLYSLLLLAHATPLIIIAMACGLLEAPTISRLFEIETHDANRNEVWGSLITPDAPLQPLVTSHLSSIFSLFSPPIRRTNSLMRRPRRVGPRSSACSSPSAPSPSAQCACCGTTALESGSPKLRTCHAPPGCRGAGMSWG